MLCTGFSPSLWGTHATPCEISMLTVAFTQGGLGGMMDPIEKGIIVDGEQESWYDLLKNEIYDDGAERVIGLVVYQLLFF